MGLNQEPVDLAEFNRELDKLRGDGDRRWEHTEAYLCESGDEVLVYWHPGNLEWTWERLGDIPGDGDGAGYSTKHEAAKAAVKEVWDND